MKIINEYPHTIYQVDNYEVYHHAEDEYNVYMIDIEVKRVGFRMIVTTRFPQELKNFIKENCDVLYVFYDSKQGENVLRYDKIRNNFKLNNCEMGCGSTNYAITDWVNNLLKED